MQTQLSVLPPGERYTPVLRPYGFPWMLSLAPGGHARMLFKGGVLYLAMLHGKQFPDDLTGPDVDRAGAHGVLFGGDVPCPWPEFDAPPLAPETVETLTTLLRRALPRARVEVDGTRRGDVVLTVRVEVGGCRSLALEVCADLFEAYAGRLPSLSAVIVRNVKRHRPTC